MVHEANRAEKRRRFATGIMNSEAGHDDLCHVGNLQPGVVDHTLVPPIYSVSAFINGFFLVRLIGSQSPLTCTESLATAVTCLRLTR